MSKDKDEQMANQIVKNIKPIATFEFIEELIEQLTDCAHDLGIANALASVEDKEVPVILEDDLADTYEKLLNALRPLFEEDDNS